MGPTVATTKVVEDIDGEPHGGCYRWVQKRPPLKVKEMSMAGSLRVLPVGPAASTTEVVKDVDNGPLGGATGRSGSGHQ
jgi:hypothetical protein